MSIQSEIDRIETGVGTQSGLINQIQTELENKFEIDISRSVSDTPLNNNTVNLQNTLSGIKNIVVPDGIEPQEYVWNQIPTLVKEYLDNVIYDPTDTTSSSIAQYAPATPNIENTWPIGQSVEVSSGILERNGFKQNVTAGNVTLYNDVPQEFTEYSVNNNGIISQTGSLKPTGFLRQIKSANAKNVRDLGGWTCDGGTIKYGKLFRGGEINASDRTVLVEQCGVMFELNLRGGETAGERSYSVLGSDIGYALVNGNDVWYSIGANTLSTWKTLLKIVFNNAIYNIPTYFHCAAGADRTGTVSCILEAILGVSRSDIDKDYELTSFSTGTSTEEEIRGRNETDWQNLINQINNLLRGSNFRDRVINWVASLGFSVDEINSFRSAMINGTPDIIALDYDTYTVTNQIGNVITDNSQTSVVQYQPYQANLSVQNGFVIGDVKIVMGGVDVTSLYFNGCKTNLNRNIVFYLTGCIVENKKSRVINGQSYVCKIIANEGYTLVGGTITITMGGTDVSEYYSEGTIAIPNVTGNIVITATAIKDAYTNIIETVGYQNNTRLSSDGTTKTADGFVTTGMIDVSTITKPLIVRTKGVNFTYNTYCYLVGCTSSGNTLGVTTFPNVINNLGGSWSGFSVVADGEGNLTITVRETATGWFKFCGYGSGENLIITINEEII